LFRSAEFKGITPNGRGDWLNQANEYEDWNRWLPIVSKEAKLGKTNEVIFKLHSLGVVTARDEWICGHSETEVSEKTQALIEMYQAEQERWKKANNADNSKGIEAFVNRSIKWTTELTAHLVKGTQLKYQPSYIVRSAYRPFVHKHLYYDKFFVHRTYQQLNVFPVGKNVENLSICFLSIIPCLDLLEKTQFLPLWVYDKDGSRHDNITDWALKQFQAHYENPTLVPTRGVGMPSHRAAVQDAARGNEIKVGAVPCASPVNSGYQGNHKGLPLQEGGSDAARGITKTDIFNYVYAVLHDPRYREKFALNLKAEFPRIPFHPDFAAWAAIGAKLIKLHAEFEHVEPFTFERVESSVSAEPLMVRQAHHERLDSPKTTAKTKLKADKIKHCIEIDSQTTLANIPPEAWQYQLGNRSALEWVLDQYKEKTPKDPTIREKFNSYRFADHKESVIELLGKVCRVSVETMALIEEIQALTWD
jgi:predicted helicase